MAKANSDKKVDSNKISNTQTRWLKKMKRYVAANPKDKQAAAALERGVHPVRKKPRKDIWRSAARRRFAHALRLMGQNGKIALLNPLEENYDRELAKLMTKVQPDKVKKSAPKPPAPETANSP